MTEEQIAQIQDNVSNCRRPSRTDTTNGSTNSDSSFGQLPATPAINL